MDKRRGSWMIGLAISAIALLAAFWGFQPDRLWASLSQGRYALLIPVALVMLLGLMARALGWRILLGKRVSLRRSFFALNEGYLLNAVLPLRLGELGRAYIVSRAGDLQGGLALATIVLERLLDTGVNLVTLFVALGFMVAPVWAQDIITVAGLALALAAAVLIVLSLQGGWLSDLLRRVPGKIFARLAQVADDFKAGLDILKQPADLAQALFWNILSWLMVWLQFWLLLQAFGRGGTMLTAIFLAGVIAFGAALPSSPGAVGVYEFAAVAGLTVFGYPRELALGVAIIGHAMQLAVTGMLGAWGLIRDGWTVVSLAQEARGFLQDTEQEALL